MAISDVNDIFNILHCVKKSIIKYYSMRVLGQSPRRRGSGKRRRRLERGEGFPLLQIVLIFQSDVAGGGADFDC